MRFFTAALLAIALLAGCSSKSQEANTGEHATIQSTVWSEETELFMEYDSPQAGTEASFLVHMTTLEDFKPLSDAALNMTFTPQTGEPVIVRIDKPQRPGIYKANVMFKQAGTYTLKAAYTHKGGSDSVIVQGIEVRDPARKDAVKQQSTGQSGAGISFLKEQQWTVEFMTGVPIMHTISSSLTVAGEIVPLANGDVTVTSPLAGIISPAPNTAYLGKKVSQGEVLAIIEPPLSGQGGMGQLNTSHAEARGKLVLAEQEFDRAKRLYEAKAVPKRRLDEAELALESARAAFAPLERARQEMKGSVSENKMVVKSPISGTVAEMFIAGGKSVEAGQPLFRIVNASTVWLKASVPATDIGSVNNIASATFTVSGLDREFKPSRLVTINDVVDPSTRTVPVLFEVANGNNSLKIGMFADVSIKTGLAENALTLPEEAFFEDEGRFFVFVQREGESFERREVKTGIRGNGRVQIVSGIKAAERVVVRGGYYVKLASMSSRLPQGHGHDH